MSVVKTKIQIFTEAGSAFGPGKAQLLAAIIEHGSISAAAKSMKMSYKRAWDLVCAMNDAFKENLVITKIGGSHGGGAEVTPFGQKVLSAYQCAVVVSQDYVEAQLSDLTKLLK